MDKSNDTPIVLVGEPAILRDRFELHATRRGHAPAFTRVAPAPPRTKGWPNPVLQADRVQALLLAQPSSSNYELASHLGYTETYIRVLRHITQLPEEIRTHVRSLATVTVRAQVTGRDLRRLVAIRGSKQQVAAFRALVCRKR